jgi:hypothetical protein
MKRGYVVSNEYNNFQTAYYCGGCLDTYTGVEDLPNEEAVHVCIYCGTELGTYEDMQAYPGDDESEDSDDYDSDDDGSVRYAEGFTFVNVYEVDRAYGGPEEGGWYYDTGRLVLSRQVPSADAESVRASLREQYPSTGKSSSVIYPGYGDYTIHLDSEPGADYPDYTPHYE